MLTDLLCGFYAIHHRHTGDNDDYVELSLGVAISLNSQGPIDNCLVHATHFLKPVHQEPEVDDVDDVVFNEGT